MKRKILALLLAIVVVTVTVAVATGEGLPEGAMPRLPEPGTVFYSYEGVVTDVGAYYENDIAVESKYYVSIETEEGPVRFFINEESKNILGTMPEVGDAFIGFYDASLPVIMIYPPQYTAVAFVSGLDKIEYIVNDTKIEAPAPYINDDFTVMVPARAICEALDYKVVWNGTENTAEIGVGIRFTIGKDYYTIGRAAPIELGSAPVAENNRAFVPLSFFRNVIKMNNAYYFEGQIVINNDEKME